MSKVAEKEHTKILNRTGANRVIEEMSCCMRLFGKFRKSGTSGICRARRDVKGVLWREKSLYYLLGSDTPSAANDYAGVAL